MRADKVILGESYRHRSNPTMGWARPVRKLLPKQAPNVHTYTIFECEWTVGQNDVTGLTKYFRADDLVKVVEK
jgi:hypothetical protein